jgi:probable HAF family extracellular repeat protein
MGWRNSLFLHRVILARQTAMVNDRGQVVGWSTTANGETHAFLYKDSVMTDLGVLGGAFSDAFGINDRGEIVGQSETASGAVHAFLFKDGVMHDLGTLP